MRITHLLVCFPLVGCATPVAENQAGNGGSGQGDHDAAVPDGGGGGGTAGSAGDAGTEAGAWPGDCVDGQSEDCYSGPPATKDVGACHHGSRVCAGGHFPTSCTGDVLPVAQESCNGVDDNCDGTVDEGCACTDGDSKPCYGGATGTEGVGPCKGGTQTCVGGTWSTCNGAVLPAVETCNGADDDCNGTVDDHAGLRLYSLQFSGSGSTAQYLSEAWSDPKAPPRCADVMATVQLTDIGRLLVFTTDGQLYWRKNGTWMPPTAATARFPSLPATIDAVYQVPHSLFDVNAAGGADLTFTASPYAYLYTYDQNDSVSGFQKVTMTDETAKGGPNQAGAHALWMLERFDPALYQKSGDAFLAYSEYDNGMVYKFDAAFAWTSWPVAQSPLWAGKSNAPPVGQCVAGFADHAPDVLYLICP